MANTPVSVLDNIHEFVVVQGNGVKGLADTGITKLPKQYIHPPEKRLDLNKVINKDQYDQHIPVIDMSSSDRATMESQICNAAKTWGFFQVVNHGIPLKLMEDVQLAARRFFESPVEVKRAYLKANRPSERIKYSTSFVPDFETCLEWKDTISMTFESEEEIMAVWPIAFRNEALEYVKSATSVINQMFDILLRGLNINVMDERTKSNFATKTLNLIYYPKCPEPELTVGIGAHADASMFTMLIQDDVGGLHVRGLDGESWVNIPPIKGALTFNIGDAFQIVSNDIYKSVEHMVIPNGNKSRISVPLFILPNEQVILSPFPEVMKVGEKPKYKEVRYLDCLNHYFTNVHNGKTMLAFAKV